MGGQWHDFLPGSLVLGTFVIVMRVATAVYLVPKWGSLSERYGNIGIVLVMLAWAYIISYAVIGGAQLNAGLFSTRSESPAPTDGARSWPLYDLLRKRWEQFRSTGDDSKTPS